MRNISVRCFTEYNFYATLILCLDVLWLVSKQVPNTNIGDMNSSFVDKMISVCTRSPDTIYRVWVIHGCESCTNNVVTHSWLNPSLFVASGSKLYPDMKWMTWFDSTFDKQILWRHGFFFPPFLCMNVCNLCVCVWTRGWMQTNPLATVKNHAKQTRDGNNRVGGD